MAATNFKNLDYKALVDEGKLENVSVPVATGEKRYILAKDPIHPTGKPFLAPVEYKGFFMESHNNREAAIAQLKKLIKSVGCTFHPYSLVSLANRINDHEMAYEQLGTYIWVELEEGNISGVEHFLEVIKDNSPDGFAKNFESWIAEAKQKAKQEEKPKNKGLSSIKQISKLNVFEGCLLGCAVGDALGTTAEFMSPGSFPEITTISGGGPFGLNPGEWTDDTSMALCLADSLIECGDFNPVDQMQRYCRWKNEGYLSSNGSAFDIGLTVRTALENFERQSGEELNPFCGSTSPSKAGNGSLMRLAPVVLFYANDAGQAISFAAKSSLTTHGAREAVDACRYFAALITGALQGKSKEELLSAHFTPVEDLWEMEPLAPKIAEIAAGSFKAQKPPQIIGSSQGYVVLSLHAALWAFYHTDNFKDGALKVVNLGYDADTYGAIYGQLAGAFYGKDAIPAEWLDVLAKKDLIDSFARKLCEGAAGNINTE